MRNDLRFWFFLLACCFVSNIQAAGRWFHIEIIVFKQDYPGNEIFEQNQSQIQWPRRRVVLSPLSRSLSVLRQAPQALIRVQAADRMLNPAYAALKRSRAYQPLLHLAWVQRVAANSISDAVRVQSDEVNGFIRIQRGSYLHLLADMEYKPGPVIFHLKEKRRLKLNETHYLDHPKFGIIARVSPL